MSEIVSGRQLRAARVLAGLTQAQFATKAGFHERACRYWESMGDKLPTSVPSTLEKIGATLEAEGIVAFREPTPGVRIAEKR